MTITPDMIMAHNPCAEYPRSRVERLLPPAGMGLSDIMRLSIIPAEDRIWVATRPGVLTRDQATAWLDQVVHRAIWMHAADCGVPAVEEWAEEWLLGIDRSPGAAWAAARAAWAAWAARAAARAAAMAAAMADAMADAVAAAAAATNAARAAAAAAAAAASGSEAVERESQIEDLIEILASFHDDCSDR